VTYRACLDGQEIRIGKPTDRLSMIEANSCAQPIASSTRASM
jgi:hypothetical protein